MSHRIDIDHLRHFAPSGWRLSARGWPSLHFDLRLEILAFHTSSWSARLSELLASPSFDTPARLIVEAGEQQQPAMAAASAPAGESSQHPPHNAEVTSFYTLATRALAVPLMGAPGGMVNESCVVLSNYSNYCHFLPASNCSNRRNQEKNAVITPVIAITAPIHHQCSNRINQGSISVPIALPTNCVAHQLCCPSTTLPINCIAHQSCCPTITLCICQCPHMVCRNCWQQLRKKLLFVCSHLRKQLMFVGSHLRKQLMFAQAIYVNS